jgi:hypothetical protein
METLGIKLMSMTFRTKEWSSVTTSNGDGQRNAHSTAGAAVLAAQGYPIEDDYSLSSSPLRFDDGGHYRIEISGVERLSTLEAMLDEASRRDVHVHRIVCFGGGATLIDRGELTAFAELAAESRIEVIAVPGPRTGWDTGRQALTEEGTTAGRRVRGIDNLRYLLDDYLRILSCGFRGLLVWDEGMLDILNRARAAGDIPSDVVFKVSVYTGYANPAGIKLLEELGADSVNPVGDLSRPMLGAIRSAVQIPLDVWALTFESFGGINRLWEAGDVARVASPVYFKIEPGESEGMMYNPWIEAEFHDKLIRHKVRHASILNELAQTTDSSIVVSPAPERISDVVS